MIGWIWRVIAGRFNGCQHKWDFYREIDVYQSTSSKLPWATKVILRCTQCGDIKKMNL